MSVAKTAPSISPPSPFLFHLPFPRMCIHSIVDILNRQIANEKEATIPLTPEILHFLYLYPGVRPDLFIVTGRRFEKCFLTARLGSRSFKYCLDSLDSRLHTRRWHQQQYNSNKINLTFLSNNFISETVGKKWKAILYLYDAQIIFHVQVRTFLERRVHEVTLHELLHCRLSGGEARRRSRNSVIKTSAVHVSATTANRATIVIRLSSAIDYSPLYRPPDLSSISLIATCK